MAQDTGTRTSSLDERVYQDVRDMIIQGDLKPGQQIIQEAVADKLGVSRTPLRKAIATLARENLVDMTSRGAAYVRSFSDSEFISIWEIRAVLEGLVCRMAAKKARPQHVAYLRALITEAAARTTGTDWSAYLEADQEFHDYLIKTVNDPLLTNILESFHVLSFTIAQGLLRAPSDTLPEHLEILDAIEAKDVDKAESAMIAHIRKSNIHLKRKLAQQTFATSLPETYLSAIRQEALAIAERTGETVIVAVEDEGQARVIFVAEGKSLLRVAVSVDSMLPLHATAVGKALLSRKGAEELISFSSDSRFKVFTSTTIGDPEDLAHALNGVRETNIATENGDYEPGLAGVATVLELPGVPPVAVGVQLPVVRLETWPVPDLAGILHRSGKKLSSIS